MHNSRISVTGKRFISQTHSANLFLKRGSDCCSINAFFLFAVCIAATLVAKDLIAFFTEGNPNTSLPAADLIPIDTGKAALPLASFKNNDKVDAEKFIDGAPFAHSGLEKGSVAYNEHHREGAPRPMSLPPADAPVAFPKNIDGRYVTETELRDHTLKVLRERRDGASEEHTAVSVRRKDREEQTVTSNNGQFGTGNAPRGEDPVTANLQPSVSRDGAGAVRSDDRKGGVASKGSVNGDMRRDPLENERGENLIQRVVDAGKRNDELTNGAHHRPLQSPVDTLGLQDASIVDAERDQFRRGASLFEHKNNTTNSGERDQGGSRDSSDALLLNSNIVINESAWHDQKVETARADGKQLTVPTEYGERFRQEAGKYAPGAAALSRDTEPHFNTEDGKSEESSHTIKQESITEESENTEWRVPFQPVRDPDLTITMAELYRWFGLIPANLTVVSKTTLQMLKNYDIQEDDGFKELAAEGSLPYYRERYIPVARRGWGSVLGGTPSSIPIDHLYHVRHTGDFVKGYGVYASTDIPEKTILGIYGGELVNVEEIESGQYAWEVPTMTLRSPKTGDYLNLSMVVDSSRIGNLLRFVNDLGDEYHNLEPIWVPIDNMWNMFYETSHPISAGEELSISYGDNYWGGGDTQAGEENSGSAEESENTELMNEGKGTHESTADGVRATVESVTLQEKGRNM